MQLRLITHFHAMAVKMQSDVDHENLPEIISHLNIVKIFLSDAIMSFYGVCCEWMVCGESDNCSKIPALP